MGSPVSFDVDCYGEIYMVDYNGNINKLVNRFSSWVKEFTVQTGHVVSGSTRNLIQNDDKSLQVENTSAGSKDYVITVFGRTNITTRNFLDLDVVGSMSTGTSGLLRISLKRWTDNQFVQVSAQTADATKRRFRLSGLSAQNYVRAGDGRIELKLDLRKSGTVSGFTRVMWDQVLFKVN